MRSSTKSRQEEYVSRLNKLYSDMEKWIKDTDLKASRGKMELQEEVPGSYDAPTLTIQDAQGKKAAELLPVGAWIIGAEGRVDLVGLLNRETLIYLAEGGPQITTKVAIGGDAQETHSTPLFRGVKETGWYWIERSRPSRARRLTAELFMDLLSEVSGHDA